MNEITVFDEVRTEMVKYKKINADIVFDYNDPVGNKEARSHIAKLRTIKTRIASVHKDAKAEALAVCRALDADKREYTGEVEEMIAVHNDPIQEIEARKQAEIDDKIESDRLAQEIAEEQRQEELRQREEAIIKAEDEAKAKADKLEADRAAFEAEKNAEARAVKREQAAREQAVKEEQDRAAQKVATEKAEADRLAEIERLRVEDVQHRTEIEKEMWDGLFIILKDDILTDTVAHYIKIDEIPHVTILY